MRGAELRRRQRPVCPDVPQHVLPPGPAGRLRVGAGGGQPPPGVDAARDLPHIRQRGGPDRLEHRYRVGVQRIAQRAGRRGDVADTGLHLHGQGLPVARPGRAQQPHHGIHEHPHRPGPRPVPLGQVSLETIQQLRGQPAQVKAGSSRARRFRGEDHERPQVPGQLPETRRPGADRSVIPADVGQRSRQRAHQPRARQIRQVDGPLDTVEGEGEHDRAEAGHRPRRLTDFPGGRKADPSAAAHDPASALRANACPPPAPGMSSLSA